MILAACVARPVRRVLASANMRRVWGGGIRTGRAWIVRTGLGLAVLSLLGGCAAGLAPPGPAPRPRPRPGYERRVDELASVDASALAGRRIAIDPGHGGVFRGAVGVNGLTEAEVNLGVALFLRGLLEARGAQVFLTRSDDRDFLSPADSSLRSDLAERTRLANAFHPDLFLSIHHNADAGGAHDVNAIQTYYKLGDEGPSLDAAQQVHRYLVRNLGIEAQRVLPGNYFVLRNCESPAILTESSYITNPDVESKLALAAKQRLEAEALFLGLARTFARRAPRIAAFAAALSRGGRPDTVFRDLAGPILSARIEGAFDRAELTLDGRDLGGQRTGAELEWDPGLLAPGPHEAVLRVRLAGAGAAPERRLRFVLARSPARFEVDLESARDGLDSGVTAVGIRVLDAFGMPVSDSTAIRLHELEPGRVLPGDTLVTSSGGVAWAYLRLGAGGVRAPAGPGRRGSQSGGLVRAAIEGGASQARCPPAQLDLAGAGGARDPELWRGFALLMPEGVPLARAPGTLEPDRRIPWLNRDGFAELRRDAQGRLLLPSLPGYRPWGDDSMPPPRLAAIGSGALFGRRIVIDPDGGGEDPGGSGRNGTRAAALNLDVARALAAMLEAAGAEARLTRGGDLALSDVERVQISESFRADRFLRIGHRAERPRFGHYFSSAAGRSWAQRTAGELGRMGLPVPPDVEDAQYPLQQTSCPALYVSPARVDDPVSEERLLAPGTLRAEAYALLLGLLREWAPGTEWPTDSVEVRDPGGHPLAGVSVTLGGSLVLETDARGRVRFARTEPGPLEVRALDRRISRRVVLLDSERGAVLIGSGSP